MLPSLVMNGLGTALGESILAGGSWLQGRGQRQTAYWRTALRIGLLRRSTKEDGRTRQGEPSGKTLDGTIHPALTRGETGCVRNSDSGLWMSASGLVPGDEKRREPANKQATYRERVGSRP